MRFPFATLLVLSSCRVARMLPGKPVLSPQQIADWPSPPPPPNITYTGPPTESPRVPPLQIFGVYYDLDLVLVTRDTGWDMHEYARLQTPDGPIWMAKDADEAGVQTIIAPVQDIRQMAAEVPIPRRRGDVRATDTSTGTDVNVSLSYQNVRDINVEVAAAGRLPDAPPRRRNGSTMGHSRQAAMVVLDLERFGPMAHAEMRMEGTRTRIDRIAGARMQYLIRQAQGGIAVTSLTASNAPSGITMTRPGPDATAPATGQPGWPTARTERWTATADTLSHDDGWTAITYDFVDDGLAAGHVYQSGRSTAVFDLLIDPALPDLRRPFSGVHTSRIRLDVNGQAAHATGTIEVWWADDTTVELRVRADAPWWVADRPLDGRLRYAPSGAVHLETWRVTTPLSSDSTSPPSISSMGTQSK